MTPEPLWAVNEDLKPYARYVVGISRRSWVAKGSSEADRQDWRGATQQRNVNSDLSLLKALAVISLGFSYTF